jgi:hypothetical protein
MGSWRRDLAEERRAVQLIPEGDERSIFMGGVGLDVSFEEDDLVEPGAFKGEQGGAVIGGQDGPDGGSAEGTGEGDKLAEHAGGDGSGSQVGMNNHVHHDRRGGLGEKGKEEAADADAVLRGGVGVVIEEIIGELVRVGVAECGEVAEDDGVGGQFVPEREVIEGELTDLNGGPREFEES